MPTETVRKIVFPNQILAATTQTSEKVFFDTIPTPKKKVNGSRYVLQKMMERRRLDDPDGEEGEEGWTMLFTTPGLRKNFLVMIGTLSVFQKRNIATKLLPKTFFSQHVDLHHVRRTFEEHRKFGKHSFIIFLHLANI